MKRRNLEAKVRAALADTPVVVVHGARQTGKSTLVRAIAASVPRRRYVTLDDSTALGAASAAPSAFAAGFDGPVVIDEVQRAPGLFRAIKGEVDRDREAGRFLLTGSANVLMLPRIGESLAGRVEIVTLWPMSQGEIEGREERFVEAVFAPKLKLEEGGGGGGLSLVERVVRGGYPEPIERASEERRAAWYSSYVTAILQRDVRDMANVEGLTEFPRLLSLIASRAAGLLNFSDLSRGLSMPQSTLKRYFALLEATFLVVALPAWSNNRGLRLTKAPKVMMSDTGLACAVLGMDRARLEADGNARGALIENFVAMELMKQAGWCRGGVRVFHFRTVSGREVDLVLEDSAGRVVGVEVKSGGEVRERDFDGLRALKEAAGAKFVRGVVVYDGPEVVSFGKEFAAVPVGRVWGV